MLFNCSIKIDGASNIAKISFLHLVFVSCGKRHFLEMKSAINVPKMLAGIVTSYLCISNLFSSIARFFKYLSNSGAVRRLIYRQEYQEDLHFRENPSVSEILSDSEIMFSKTSGYCIHR